MTTRVRTVQDDSSWYDSIPAVAPGTGLFITAVLVLCGCATPGTTPSGKRLTLDAFVASAAETGPGERGASRVVTARMEDLHSSENADTDVSELVVTDPLGARQGLVDVGAKVGEPVRARSPVGAGPSGKLHLIDAKVGDVNGRAVFASQFFEVGTPTLTPLGPRLSAEARTMPLARWRVFAREQIARSLNQLVQDELLRAEALTMLTPEQKQGFFAFMEKVQQDLQRQRGGSRAQADRALRESQGITIDEWRRKQEDEQLVRLQLSDRILRRVSVSYRDIEQRYEQQRARFDPPPRAVFRLVQVSSAKPEDVEAFARELASAASFADAARSVLNINKPQDGGLEVRELRGPRSGGDFFANAQLNEAARTMRVGETVGPIRLSSTSAWLHLEREGAERVSLYDAQLTIEDELREQRGRRELERYVRSLQSKQSITDLERMVERLARIAEERYFRPTGGGA